MNTCNGLAPMFVTNLSGSGLLYKAQCAFEHRGKTYSAGGLGYSENEAAARAEGELLERMAALYVRGEREIIHVSFDSLESFEVSSAPWNSMPFRWWVKGRDLMTAEDRLIPASRVFLAFEGETTLEQFYDSNGLASHMSLDLAIDTALLEVVERDVVFEFWSNSERSADRLLEPIQVLPEKLKLYLIERELKLDCYLLPPPVEHGLYTVVSLLTNPRGSCALGSACSTDLVKSCEKSALEAILIKDSVKLLAADSPNWLERSILHAHNSGEIAEYLGSKIRIAAPAQGFVARCPTIRSRVISAVRNMYSGPICYFDFGLPKTVERFAVRVVIADAACPFLEGELLAVSSSLGSARRAPPCFYPFG